MRLGLTLLEVGLGLAILSTLYVGIANISDRFAEDTKVTTAANQAQTFGWQGTNFPKILVHMQGRSICLSLA
jgi:hypothetical protein